MNSSTKLHALLKLERLNGAPSRFRTISKPKAPPGAKGTFGGILVSQSLLASMQTVPIAFRPSSLHSYFLIGGNPNHHIEYDVESLRAGKNFIHKQVKAYQFNKLIFISTILFYRKPKPDKLHALNKLGKLQELPPFDKFYPSTQLFEKDVLSNGNLPKFKRISSVFQGSDEETEKVRERFEAGSVDYRFPNNFFVNQTDSDQLDYYLRVREDIGEEELEQDENEVSDVSENDARFNYIAFAYLSDSYVLLSLPYFHKLPLYSHKFSVSLDHTIYFHQLPRVSKWMFAQLFNPRSYHDKHLILGHYYDRESKSLVATITQEGLVAYQEKDVIMSKFHGDSKL
ncbi:peroxisomal acyl-coenzyme A thioester hydrolase 1 [Kluyveromyces marxianus DMKU3-1042]|uniref:Peroxisomal acyl-coenzyme A thioester hydrolase 1 n=1 Tax=Kluyveromyces marxianus (strain DMKU3-1042 / BCC 29191 / NBRC 104275) TaxID=1003335 RepID=W0TCM8_KLUMD|nr:peroxisomal acyl-coenzyme A thioester hydrolase 1 [Kluyveromyces marxianus DMKU3-1042]BAO41377.1 peroxisomal acyl-coenzyme A thioester hydrolase 1 [Kluyveromyces marxianus DMKU3-1042]